VASHHGDDDLVPEEDVDVVVSAGRLHPRMVEEMRIFEPCGKGNPSPKVVITGNIDRPRVVKEKHLAFQVGGISAIWWGEAGRLEMLQGATAVLGTLSLNVWNGQTSVQIAVDDIA
jgi:single-stranded-DNA-specific exonuclease